MIEGFSIQVFGNRRISKIINSVDFGHTDSEVVVKEKLYSHRSCPSNADFVGSHQEVPVLELRQTAPTRIVNTDHIDVVDQLKVKIPKHISVGSSLDRCPIVSDAIVVNFLKN